MKLAKALPIICSHLVCHSHTEKDYKNCQSIFTSSTTFTRLPASVIIGYVVTYSDVHICLQASEVNRDLSKISAWCNVWDMRLNPNKIQSMILGRIWTVLSPHSDLFISNTSLNSCTVRPRYNAI